MKEQTIEQLISLLADAIANEGVEIKEQQYNDEAVEYANEGVTKRTYMTGEYAAENLQTYIEEDLADTISVLATERYFQIVNTKYRKKAVVEIW